MKNKLLIFGNGEIAELAKYYFDKEGKYEVVAFVIDKKYIKENKFKNLPVIALEEVEKQYGINDYFFHVALSYQKLNNVKEKKYLKIKKKKYKFASFISENSIINTDKKNLGENLFILENQTIQNNVIIKDNVMIWSSNHIGHGTIINSHTYISSHVVISGHCNIGEKCFFGVNAAVADFCTIGQSCFIGMGTNISTNIKANSTVISKNSETFLEDSRVGNLIKKKYFKF